MVGDFKQTIKIFGVLFFVLVFGVLLGVSLADIGYVPVVATQEQKEIQVDLAIDYGNGDSQMFPGQEIGAGDSVLSLFEKSGVTLEKRNFPGLGVFIEAINGVHNSNNYYWQFWVNGEYANIGASEYELRHGDQVLWKRTNEIPSNP
ncbi:MAG TPA: DUF4430 domain-containing protein [Candidatus Paceibacterota bacterium]